MDEHPEGPAAPARRLRALPSVGGPCDPYPVDALQRAPVLHEAGTEAPRVAGLDALLREVDELRSSVRRDLSLAATAIEADEPGLAAYLLSTADTSVRDFQDSATDRLDALGGEPAGPEGEPLLPAVGDAFPVRGRTRRMLPAAPLVAAAAALFVGLAAASPSLTGDLGSSSNANASRSFDEFERLAKGGASPQDVSRAAEDLHADLASLLAAASSDPQAARDAIELLTKETAVLRRSIDSAHPELQQVLAEAQALVTLLRRAAQRPQTPAVPVVVPVEPARSEPSPKASPAPSQKASPKPAPSSAKPSPSSSPSSTPTKDPSPQPSSSDDPSPLVPGLD